MWNVVAGGGAAKTIDLEILQRPNGGVWRKFGASSLYTQGGQHFQHFEATPWSFPAKTDLVVRANTSGTTDDIEAGYQLVLVDD